jgi:hypothetical protein
VSETQAKTKEEVTNINIDVTDNVGIHILCDIKTQIFVNGCLRN